MTSVCVRKACPRQWPLLTRRVQTRASESPRGMSPAVPGRRKSKPCPPPRGDRREDSRLPGFPKGPPPQACHSGPGWIVHICSVWVERP